MAQVLVVDDDPTIRALLQLVLKRSGLDVDIARDGVEALDLLRCTRYTVAVIDLQMPRMNGYDLITVLREFESRPAVVVVTAMTNAFVDVLDSEIVQAVIRKPFDIDMLSTVVGEIVAALEGRGLERQAFPFLQVKNAAPRGRSIT